MKKVVVFAAVVCMTVGFYSCEQDNNLEETQALYENVDLNSGDDQDPKDNGSREESDN